MAEPINDFNGYLGDFPRGTTVPVEFELVDADGVAIDVTDCSIYIMLSTSSSGEQAADVETTISPSDPTNGIFTGDISDTDTLTLTPGTYYYSMKFINAAGKAYTFDQGKIKVFKSVNPRIE